MAGTDRAVIYVIDSSSWISIDGHPAANRILYCLADLIERGAVKVVPEVWDELKRSEYVISWLKSRRKQVVHNLRQKVEYLQIVGRVTYDFPGMSGARGTRNKADPYVVAYAVYTNQTSNPAKVCVVVCDETVRSRPNRKIPGACAAYGVEVINLMDLLRREFPDEEW